MPKEEGRKVRRNRWFLAGLTAVVALSFLAVGLYSLLPEMLASAIAYHQRRAVEKTPAAYRLEFESVAIPADSGVTLAGWWLPSVRDGSRRPILGAVVMSHGIYRNREQVLGRAAFLARSGYQVLMFDLRGHGGNLPAPMSAGLREADDYRAALRFLKETRRGEKPVVLFGLSLSAMAALRAAAGGPTDAPTGVATGASVDAVIADSPLRDARSYVSKRTFAGLFLRMPGFFQRCLQAYNKKTGLALKEGDLDLTAVVRGVDVPVLYLSGEKDDLSTPQDMQALFNATKDPHKRLVYIPGAGHDDAYRKFKIGYERAVLEFLKNVREGFPEAKGRPSGR